MNNQNNQIPKDIHDRLTDALRGINGYVQQQTGCRTVTIEIVSDMDALTDLGVLTYRINHGGSLAKAVVDEAMKDMGIKVKR